MHTHIQIAIYFTFHGISSKDCNLHKGWVKKKCVVVSLGHRDKAPWEDTYLAHTKLGF